MKVNLIMYVLFGLIVFSNCQDSANKEVKNLQVKINNLEEQAKTEILGEELLSAYEDLLGHLTPPDTLWDQTMWKKAQTIRFLGDGEKAVAELQLLFNQGSEMMIREDALFMAGFIEDEDLKNDVRAEMFYRQFLDQFPNSQKKEQVETLLRFIGKTNEEILMELQKQSEG